MTDKIILLANISDLDIIPNWMLSDDNVKIFSFDYETHKELERKNVKHDIADDLLDQDQRLRIFDRMIELRSWYSKIPSENYIAHGVNVLKIFDTHEFQSYLMPVLINLVIIKKIIEQEKPQKIISTTSLSNIIYSIAKQNEDVEIFPNDLQKKLLWDKISFKYNIGYIPITFSLSRNNYLKTKNFLEKIFGFLYGFWFDFNSDKKKAIVFLEFNPQLFSKLFQSMKNYDGSIILVNQRRSAVWNKNSIDVITKSKCRVLKSYGILNKEEKSEATSLINKLSKNIEILWANSELLDKIFQIDGICFWNVIKEVMLRNYSERLSERVHFICNLKKLSDNVDLRCVVTLNETGETEKTFLEFNNRTPSVLLEHGFIERNQKTKRFDVLSDYDSFKDKIAVWGEMKKEWLSTEYGIEQDRIIVTGSPRHDHYFNSRFGKKDTEEKILLIAPNPINDINGTSSTTLKLRVDRVLEEIFSLIKKLNNVKIIVKLHPIQLKHNEEIKSLIKKLDNTTPIYLWTPISDTINGADAVLVISPEIHGTSTMLLESMILGKPTMNIYFDESVPDYYHIRNNAVFTITDSYDLKDALQKILFDEKFQTDLKINADNFVTKFLSNRGNASEKFAAFLKSY